MRQPRAAEADGADGRGERVAAGARETGDMREKRARQGSGETGRAAAARRPLSDRLSFFPVLDRDLQAAEDGERRLVEGRIVGGDAGGVDEDFRLRLGGARQDGV